MKPIVSKFDTVCRKTDTTSHFKKIDLNVSAMQKFDILELTLKLIFKRKRVHAII